LDTVAFDTPDAAATSESVALRGVAELELILILPKLFRLSCAVMKP
jgi:hypothetical protein